MKKMMSFLLAFVVIMIGFSACSNETEEVLLQTDEIRLTSEIAQSRIPSLDCQSTQIVSGRTVGVTITGAKNTHVNVPWTAGANGALTNGNEDQKVFWANGDIDITAYHPHQSAWEPYTFSVSANQTAETDYLNSDLLWTQKKASKTENPVSLTFEHVLSKIKVTLISDEIPDLSNATIAICGTKTSGVFNPISSDLSNISNEKEIVAGVTAKAPYVASAIIIPQEVAAGVKFVKVTHANKDYYYTLPAKKIFVRGSSYSYTLKVGSEGLESISTSITDWNEETFNGDMVEDTNNNVDANSIIIANKELSDALYTLYKDQYDITLNANGYAVMKKSEVESIVELDLDAYEQQYKKTIKTLDGIEHFKNLLNLNCRNSGLTKCDLSQNTKLKSFAVHYTNNLTSLDFSHNPEIQALYLNYNYGLSSLNLTGCTKLIALQIFDSALTSLEIPNKAGLRNLLYGASLSFNLNEFPNLTELGCENMKLDDLSFIPESMRSKLTFLSFERNNLTTIDLAEYPNLIYLDCGNNQLTTLDLSKIPNVKEISCYQNKISSLDITKLNSLEKISCGNQNDNITLNLLVTQEQNDNWESLNEWGNEGVTLQVK